MYEVGQFIYFYSRKNTQIFSARIIEEIIIKKIDSVDKDYRVDLKNKEDTQFLLSELVSVKNLKVFTDLVELKAFMMSNAESYITSLIKKCTQRKVDYWGKSDSDILEEAASSNTRAINNTLTLQLEDGTKANIIDNTGVLKDSNV
tara:strand:+ start:191 stop:628 length:438 start_codon:yes stop_codon:yes gene_type:complete